MFDKLKKGFCKCEGDKIVYRCGKNRIVFEKDNVKSMKNILEENGILEEQRQLNIAQKVISYTNTLAMCNPIEAIEACPNCLITFNSVWNSVCQGIAHARLNRGDVLLQFAFKLAADKTKFEKSPAYNEDFSLRASLEPIMY